VRLVCLEIKEVIHLLTFQDYENDHYPSDDLLPVSRNHQHCFGRRQLTYGKSTPSTLRNKVQTRNQGWTQPRQPQNYPWNKPEWDRTEKSTTGTLPITTTAIIIPPAVETARFVTSFTLVN